MNKASYLFLRAYCMQDLRAYIRTEKLSIEERGQANQFIHDLAAGNRYPPSNKKDYFDTPAPAPYRLVMMEHFHVSYLIDSEEFKHQFTPRERSALDMYLVISAAHTRALMKEAGCQPSSYFSPDGLGDAELNQITADAINCYGGFLPEREANMLAQLIEQLLPCKR